MHLILSYLINKQICLLESVIYILERKKEIDSSNLSIHSFVKVAPADPILNPHEHSFV